MSECPIILADPKLLAPFIPMLTAQTSPTRWIQSTWAGVDSLVTALHSPASSKMNPTPVLSVRTEACQKPAAARPSLPPHSGLSSPISAHPRWLLTRFTGHFGPAMAEYVLGAIIAHERHTLLYHRQQQVHP